jgi:drug/metabolite transporter (DMT)-like permease
MGLKTTTALGAGAITATLPAVVALLSVIFLRERLGLRTAGAILFAGLAIGVLEISSAGGQANFGGAGNLLVLIAVVAEAVYVILARRFASEATPSQMALIANLSGLAAFAVLVVASGDTSLPVAPAAAWLGAAAFGITSSVLALLLWFWAIARVSASIASVFTVFLPLTAAAIAIAVLHETPNPYALFGIAAAIAAIILAASSDKRGRLPLA